MVVLAQTASFLFLVVAVLVRRPHHRVAVLVRRPRHRVLHDGIAQRSGRRRRSCRRCPCQCRAGLDEKVSHGAVTQCDGQILLCLYRPKHVSS